MKSILNLITIISLTIYSAYLQADNYEDTVANWESYKDVGIWLNNNFEFNKQRQREIRNRLQTHGPEGLLVRNVRSTFSNRNGYCADAAHFARESINSIDPEYNAQWVFIKNDGNGPNHWVTGFYVNEDLYIMDYGTGLKLNSMKGIHGPYKTLNDYKDYISSLDLHPFEVGNVFWRDMPGKED